MAEKIMNNCNYEMDKHMLENDIILKSCDFEDDNTIETIIPRRRHTTAEKKSADAKWRKRFTGKKNGRSREDYKTAKVKNEWKHDIRSYSRGGYDRNGIIQNRRDIEATKDAMNDIYGQDDADRDANYFVSLVEAKENLERDIDRLEVECDEIDWMEHRFHEEMMESAYRYGFQFRPMVKVNSYAPKALENARKVLKGIEEDIDKLRNGVRQ